MLNKRNWLSREPGRHKARGASVCGSIHRNEWQRLARGSMAAALLLGGLVGCGGSDDDSGSTDGSAPPVATTPPTSQTIALDGFRAVHPGVTTRIDLSTFVRGTGATLSAMSSEQAGCSASNLDGLSADVISDSGLCEFTYEVSSEGGDASATLNTLASDKASPVIPPVSQTMTLAEASKTFDLVALLGTDWPAGYSLDPTSLVVQGGSAQGIATASGNVLTYTHPGEAVWNRILFTLTDSTKPGEDAFGALYVTVSDTANQPPAIGDIRYDYNVQSGESVYAFQTLLVDLAALPNLGITEPDGEDWQLVEVQSYSASVMPADPDSVANKQFFFQAGAVGDHIVSYVVGDHEAGFAMGLIKITVGAVEYAKSWNNIIIGDKTFQATPLYSEVTNRGVMAEAVYDDGVSNTVGGVTGSAAKSYCSNGNHLATLEELELLRTTPAADAERLEYPVERTYVIYDGGGQPLTYELNSGITASYDPASSPTQYVICVNDAGMSYSSHTTAYGVDTALSDSTWWSLGALVSEGGAGEPVVTSSTNIGSTPLTEANVQLFPPGCPQGICKVEVKGDVTTYGQFTVQAANTVNPAQTVNIALTLLQDAKVSSVEAGTNSSPADGRTANTVVVTVFDASDTPLANTAVKLNYSAPPGVTISPTSCTDAVNCTPITTDDSGNLTLTLTATTPGDYIITFPTDALVGGLPTELFQLQPGRCDYNAGVDVPGVGCFRNPDGQFRTWSEASAYCIGLGKGYHLPSKEELTDLYNDNPNGEMQANWQWPNAYYWSNTEYHYPGIHYVVSMGNGHVSTSHDSGRVSVTTCVK